MGDSLRAAHLVKEDALSNRSNIGEYSAVAEEERELFDEGLATTTPRKGKARANESTNWNSGQEFGRDTYADEVDNTAGASSGSAHRRRSSWTSTTSRRRGGAGSSAEEKRRLRRLWIRSAAINCIFIAAWYSFSTLISVYNKWMFAEDHFNFPYPLFVTSIHMLVQWLLAAFVLSVFPRLRPTSRPAANDYATKVAPCGMATGLDIGLSNLSLRTITLSFYTMCKSSGLAFVLLFAFLFKLEKPSWRLAGIIAIITSGVVLMVSTETQFHLVGMVEVLTASALGGLRWSLTQILLDKEGMGMGNPIATLFWLAPVMGVTLALCSMMFDGWITVFSNETFFGSFSKTMHTLLAVLFPGLIAFMMNVTEFGLIQRTSVVTLSVAGIFKEVAVIFLSTIVFHDVLTPINVSGLVVTIFGIALYNYLKYRQFTQAQSAKSPRMDESAEMTDSTSFKEEEELPILPNASATASGISRRSRDEERQAPLHDLGGSPSSSRSTLSLDALVDELGIPSSQVSNSTPLVRISQDNKRHQHDHDRISNLDIRVETDDDLVKIDEEIEEMERELRTTGSTVESKNRDLL